MVEYDRNQEREYSQHTRAKICVAGVGGAGLNVLDRIALDRVMEATLVGLHTDVRVLGHSMVTTKIQLGTELMRGIGSGGDPELGREAAQISRAEIKAAVQGHDMVFICCGLGGGTGSGAAPVVAQIAKECGALVLVFATMPFTFEGRRRLRQGEAALEKLQQTADALVLFENNRMGELILPREGIQKAFSQADMLMGQSVRAIASMVTQPGLVRVGIADLMAALRSPNTRCLFGFGEARGASRTADALKRALKSPLINQGQLLNSARNLLVHVAGGESLALAEVEALMKQLSKHVPDGTQILFGISVDQKLGDSIALTLLSSLSAQEMALETVETAPEKISTPETRKPSVFASILESASDLPLNHVNRSRPETPPAEIEPAVVAHVETPEPVEIPVADLFSKPEEIMEPVLEEAPPVAEIVAMTEVTPELMEEEVAAVELEPLIHAEMPQQEEEEELHEPAMAGLPPAAAPLSIFAVVDDEDEVSYETAEDEVTPVSEPVQQAPKENEVFTRQVAPKPAPRRQPEPTVLNAAEERNSYEQPTFKLTNEEITRFKGTEKTLVGGEDLDVPTWMRMRQKVRR